MAVKFSDVKNIIKSKLEESNRADLAAMFQTIMNFLPDFDLVLGNEPDAPKEAIESIVRGLTTAGDNLNNGPFMIAGANLTSQFKFGMVNLVAVDTIISINIISKPMQS